MMSAPGQFAGFPKVLLHDHLDGGLRPATILELAAEIGLELPADEPAALADWFVTAASAGSLEQYIETFSHTVAVMQTVGNLQRVAREAAIDALGPDAGWILVDDTGTAIDVGLVASALLRHCDVEHEPGQRLPELPRGLGVQRLDGYRDEVTLLALRPAAEPAAVGLTRRQYQALCAVADGTSVRLAARELDISPQTLATHLRDAYAALGVSGRVAALNVLRTTAQRLLPLGRHRGEHVLHSELVLTSADFSAFWGSREQVWDDGPVPVRLVQTGPRRLSIQAPEDFPGSLNEWLWDELPPVLHHYLSCEPDNADPD